jgi:hypothetical protein
LTGDRRRDGDADKTAPDEPRVLPDRSDEDTDLGWGELPESDDDERITRERPPHHGG